MKRAGSSNPGEGRAGRIAGQLTAARRIAACLNGRAEPGKELAGILAPFAVSEESLPEFLEEVESAWHAWGKLIGVDTRGQAPIPTPKAAPPPLEEEKLPGLDIVVVDDDRILLRQLSKRLEQLGHKVRTFTDARQALQEIFRRPPQILITDWSMPGMDGLELCRNLRRSAVGRYLYILMLTGHEEEDKVLEAFEAGINDYVTKPLQPRILMARIRAGQWICTLRDELARERTELEKKAKELALLSRKMEQLANTDLLTGLPNRRYGLKRLEQEMEAARRYGRPLGVMILDLDHFKQINDTLGHQAGDQVLRHAAQVLKQALRASDVLCRWGGEEFLAIVPNSDLSAARRLAERMRDNLASRQPKDLNPRKPVTVSIGVAASPPVKNIDQLLHLADQALYLAKERGRNRVEAMA